MSMTDYILLGIGLMVAGRYVADWRRDRHSPPHTTYSSLDSAVDAMSRVAAGLHEDMDALRREMRALVGLPAETQIPRVNAELRTTRLIAWASLMLNIAILIAWIIAEASR